MIDIGTYREQSIIPQISLRVSGEAGGEQSSTDSQCYYLGAGYWRLYRVINGADKLAGFRLAHADRTQDEIEVVERAVCVLLRLKYISPPSAEYALNVKEIALHALKEDPQHIEDTLDLSADEVVKLHDRLYAELNSDRRVV